MPVQTGRVRLLFEFGVGIAVPDDSVVAQSGAGATIERTDDVVLAVAVQVNDEQRVDGRCDIDTEGKRSRRYGRHHGRRACGGETRARLVRHIADRHPQ